MKKKSIKPWIFGALGVISWVGLAWVLKSKKSAQQAPPAAIPNLDLSQLAGTWYEVVRQKNNWQKFDDIGITYTCTPGEKGQLTLEYRWYPRHFENSPQTLSGSLAVSSPQNPGKLKLQLPKQRPQELWVLTLDPQYRYLILGHPQFQGAWIWSRTPSLDEELLEQALTLLESKGYPLESLFRTPHLPQRV